MVHMTKALAWYSVHILGGGNMCCKLHFKNKKLKVLRCSGGRSSYKLHSSINMNAKSELSTLPSSFRH